MAEYFYGITDKGKRREKNEDTFFTREMLHKQFIIACVIDGVGGYKGGDVAAGIARNVIMKNLEQLSDNVIESLQQAIVAANAKINEERKAGTSNEHMACVLTCAVIDINNNKCWYAHVGDTRIYLLRDHSLIKISKDHSAVGFLEESGRLSEEEAMRHPRRNEINKALGFEEDIDASADFIETGESAFLSGDLLLLCSDGLTDMISSVKIVSLLTTKKSLAAKAKALVDAANDAGGNDNITAILVENNKPPKQKPAPVPVERKKGIVSIPLAENKTPLMKDVINNNKSNRSRMAVLSIFVIALLVVTLTVAFQKNIKPMPKHILPAPELKKKNEQLLQLILQLSHSGKIVALPVKGTLVEVNEPIVLRKDSLLLSGNGAILIADSFYKGAAFIIDPGAKHIVLDSLVLKNFDVGMIVQKSNVTLKHVRFINCRVPVQYHLSLPDSVISGKFTDSILITHKNLK